MSGLAERPRSGLLAVDEYVGPSRLQYSDQQLQAVNRILSALPGAVRTGKSATRPAIEFMLETDPSEAVRSADLVALLEKEFQILEKRFYGGTILNVLYGSGSIHPRPLLPKPASEDTDAATHAELLPLILLLEEMLTESGTLPNDYVVIVAQKK